MHLKGIYLSQRQEGIHIYLDEWMFWGSLPESEETDVLAQVSVSDWSNEMVVEILWHFTIQANIFSDL